MIEKRTPERKGEILMTFDLLCDAELHLARLHRAVKQIADGGAQSCFCANEVWHTL
jgi:hypothetical protein